MEVCQRYGTLSFCYFQSLGLLGRSKSQAALMRQRFARIQDLEILDLHIVFITRVTAFREQLLAMHVMHFEVLIS